MPTYIIMFFYISLLMENYDDFNLAPTYWICFLLFKLYVIYLTLKLPTGINQPIPTTRVRLIMHAEQNTLCRY